MSNTAYDKMIETNIDALRVTPQGLLRAIGKLQEVYTVIRDNEPATHPGSSQHISATAGGDIRVYDGDELIYAGNSPADAAEVYNTTMERRYREHAYRT